MSYKVVLSSVLLLLLFTEGGAQDSPGQKLQEAYCTGSNEYLTSFFEEWSQWSKPISGNSLRALNAPEQKVYAIFEAFYDPLSLEKYGDVQWGGDLYRGVSYLVIQNQLKYAISNKEDVREAEFYDKNQEIKESLITSKTILPNFRPQVSTSKKPLFLENRYKKMLDAFIFSETSREGIKINKTQKRAEEYQRRIQFFEEAKHIIIPHWGVRLHYISHPLVQSIIF